MATLAPSAQVPLDSVPLTPSDKTTGESSPESGSNEPSLTTVFHNPEHFNVKHPLMHTWTLWFTKPPSGKVCHFVRTF
jgi:translation initiation factor 4E